MGYWTILIFCSVVLAVLITVTWYSVKKKNDRSERLLLCNIFNLLKQKVNILFLLKILTLISMKKMRNIAFHTQHLRRMCLI